MAENRRFTNKWTANIAKHGYTSVPNIFFAARKELGITVPQAYLLLVIESYRWSNGRQPWPSLRAIAELAGLTERSARRHIAALEAKGLIKRTERPGLTNTYCTEGLVIQLDRAANKYPQPGQKWHKTSDSYVRPTRTKVSGKEDSLEKDALIRRGYTQRMSFGAQPIGELLPKSIDFGKKGR